MIQYLDECGQARFYTITQAFMDRVEGVALLDSCQLLSGYCQTSCTSLQLLPTYPKLYFTVYEGSRFITGLINAKK
jgi:hypothetical protein